MPKSEKPKKMSRGASVASMNQRLGDTYRSEYFEPVNKLTAKSKSNEK